MTYSADERLFEVDAQYEQEHPLQLNTLYRAETAMASPGAFGFGDDDEVARFAPLAEKLKAAAAGSGLVAVGQRRSFGIWELCWYGPARKGRKLAKVLRSHTDSRLRVEEDADWRHYKEELLPRGRNRHLARNGVVISELVALGDDLAAPREIEYFIDFTRERDRDSYLRDIGGVGLAGEPTGTARPGIRAAEMAPVHLENITTITWELHERAQAANGRFNGWACSPVIKNAGRDQQ